jgi:hypothetical protein
MRFASASGSLPQLTCCPAALPLARSDYALTFKPLPLSVDEMAELIRTDGFIRFPAAITPEHCDQMVRISEAIRWISRGFWADFRPEKMAQIANIFAIQPEKRWNDGFPALGPDAEFGTFCDAFSAQHSSSFVHGT